MPDTKRLPLASLLLIYGTLISISERTITQRYAQSYISAANEIFRFVQHSELHNLPITTDAIDSLIQRLDRAYPVIAPSAWDGVTTRTHL